MDHYKISYWLTSVIGLLAEYNFLIMPMEVMGKHPLGSSRSPEYETQIIREIILYETV